MCQISRGPRGSGKRQGIKSDHTSVGVESGLYERASYGTVRATPRAAEVLGIPLGSPSESGRYGLPGRGAGVGQPRLDLNHSESVEAVDAARKVGGT